MLDKTRRPETSNYARLTGFWTLLAGKFIAGGSKDPELAARMLDYGSLLQIQEKGMLAGLSGPERAARARQIQESRQWRQQQTEYARRLCPTYA